MADSLILNNPPASSLMNPPSLLLKQAWQIYKTNFVKFIKINLIPMLGFIPLGIVFVVFALFNPANVVLNNLINPLNIVLGILGLVAIAFLIYVSASAQLGFLMLIKNLNLGVMEAVNEGRKLFWPYIVLGLTTLGLLILWTLLLIVPGIIFLIYYSFIIYVLVFEEVQGMAAIERSKELVKNHWWAVVGRFVFIGLIIYLPLTLLSSVATAMPKDSIAYQTWSSLMNLISFIVAPLFSVYVILIYKDLVRIKNNQTS